MVVEGIVWLSQHFQRSEFRCRCGCGLDTADAELIEVLETVRETFEKPVMILSGHRCDNHNARIGGVLNSQHLYGRAADIVMVDIDPEDVYRYLYHTYPGRYGLGNYFGFTHVDTRTGPAARW